MRAALFAATLMMLAASAAFAGVSNISDVSTEPYILSGSNHTYQLNVDLQSGATSFSLPLKVTCAGTGDGEKIAITIEKADPSSSSTPQYTISPSSSISLGTDTTKTASINFSNISTGDKFKIKVMLQKSDNSGPVGGVTPEITVTFIQPVPLTGVSISAHGMRDKVVTIRSNDKPVELRAAPTPHNATSVAYSWSEESDRIALDTTTGQTVHVSPADRSIGNAEVKLTATAYGETFTDTITVRVVSADELADADLLVPLDTASSTAIYAVSTDFIAAAYPSVTPDTITSKANSGLSDEAPKAILISAQQLQPGSVDVSTKRDFVCGKIAPAKDELRGRFASGMSISMDVSDYSKSGGPIAMVPLNVAFSLPEKYLNDTNAMQATSGADLQGKYRLMKYFGNDKNNGVNISSLLGAGTHFADKNESTKAYKFKPLVVMVDSAAPMSATKAPRSSDCGVKYDRTHNVLYIFDGAHDGLIHDPLVLERTPGGGGGGSGTNWFGLAGGGGCATGVGLAAMAALLAITRRRR